LHVYLSKQRYPLRLLKDTKIIAGVHPAYILRGKHVHSPVLSLQILRAAHHSKYRDILRPKWDFNLNPSEGQFRKYLSGTFTIAFDVETPRTNHTEITMCGFSTSPYTAQVVPWIEPYVSIAGDALTSRQSIAHNADFDLTAVEAYGIKCRDTFDTCIAANVLEPDYPVALHSVASRHFPWFLYWKELGHDRRQQELWHKVLNLGRYFNDWEQVYCALDVAHTYLLWQAQVAQLGVRNQMTVFTRQMECLPVLRVLEHRGLRVAPAAKKWLLKKRLAQRQEILLGVNRLIKEPWRKWTDECKEDLRTAIERRDDAVSKKASARSVDAADKTGYNKTTLQRATLSHKASSAAVTKARAKLRRMEKGFNIDSDADWRRLLFTHYKLPVLMRTSSGAPAVGKAALQTLRERGNRVQLPEAGFALLDKLEVASRIGSEIPTFIEVALDGDSVAHPGYQLFRTATGRLASGSETIDADKPAHALAYNAQNIPKSLRRMYVPHRNHCKYAIFLEADWKQIELRLMAWILGIDSLTKALSGGLDIHRENAGAIFGRTPSDITIPERTLAKRFTHGVNYGLGPYKASWLFKISVAEARKRINAYLDRWYGFRQAREALVKASCERRFIENAFGWRRRVLTKEPEKILAFLPQSSLAAMVKRCLVRVEEGVTEGTLLTTTHDSYLMEVCPKKIGRVMAAMRDIMEDPVPELDGFVCPTDFQMGASWGHLKAIDWNLINRHMRRYPCDC